ncbi:MAG: dihydroneopterin aldolase [Bacteroidota bacterium]
MIISVEGIQVIGNHGVYSEERKHGNIFQVDVYLDITPSESFFRDNILQTINYKEVYDKVLEVMRTPRNLLETLCIQLAKEILSTWEEINEVKVRIAKLRPRYMEQCEKAFVELSLNRANLKS